MLPKLDVHAARRKGQRRPAVWVNVIDLALARRGNAGEYERAENYGAFVIQRVGGRVVRSRQLRMFGYQAVGVDGEIREEDVAIRLVYVGRRKFEFRCLGIPQGDDWPCADAFQSFRIDEVPDETSEGDVPHRLHLRDTQLGLAFDPPDDTWLAIGPHRAAAGARVSWIWRNQRREIAVAVLKLSRSLGAADQQTFLAEVSRAFGRRGATATLKVSALSGIPCHYIAVAKADGSTQDMFILFRNDIQYSVAVTQPTRDEAVVEAARLGFRLTCH